MINIVGPLKAPTWDYMQDSAPSAFRSEEVRGDTSSRNLKKCSWFFPSSLDETTIKWPFQTDKKVFVLMLSDQNTQTVQAHHYCSEEQSVIVSEIRFISIEQKCWKSQWIITESFVILIGSEHQVKPPHLCSLLHVINIHLSSSFLHHYLNDCHCALRTTETVQTCSVWVKRARC